MFTSSMLYMFKKGKPKYRKFILFKKKKKKYEGGSQKFIIIIITNITYFNLYNPRLLMLCCLWLIVFYPLLCFRSKKTLYKWVQKNWWWGAKRMGTNGNLLSFCMLVVANWTRSNPWPLAPKARIIPMSFNLLFLTNCI